MGERLDFHNPEEEEEGGEEEEALSLRDLLLDKTNNNNNFDSRNSSTYGNQTPRSSSDFFEFFNNDFNVDMCPAEEIIFCGKLVPLKDHYSLVPKPIEKDKRRADFIRKRSESLSEIQGFTTPRSSSTKAKLMRNSRSLDYRKEKEIMERSLSTKKAVPKPPRWYYVFMFGMAKIPTEMELTDIKNRQSRQNPSALFPPAINNNNTSTVGRQSCGIGKGSSRLIRVLSCKDHASVSVGTTSFAWQG